MSRQAQAPELTPRPPPYGPSRNGAPAPRTTTTTTHRPPRRLLVAAALLAAVVIASAVWVLLPRAGPGPLMASGTIEYDEVTLSAQSSGRIADLSVQEGSQVAEGQVVGHLVDPVLDVQNRQAISDPAQQQLAAAQLARMQLTAPETGIVQKQIAHRGEFVGAGGPILTVADPTNLKLTLYVLEGDLGRVSLGQSVNISADAFPSRVFAGLVTTIADKAEFTPRNVQTQRDRENLVFAVTVRVPNADGALKAGLPVDATFEP